MHERSEVLTFGTNERKCPALARAQRSASPTHQRVKRLGTSASKEVPNVGASVAKRLGSSAEKHLGMSAAKWSSSVQALRSTDERGWD